MTRRKLLWSTFAARPAKGNAPLVIPIHTVADTRAKLTPEQVRRFSSVIWPETVRDFKNCGIDLQTTQGEGEVRRSPAGRPVFVGLKWGAINVVATDYIPMYWDRGRALAGVTAAYEGHHICLIAVPYAHGHEIPFLSLNTCVHELLHVLLQDVFESRPKGLEGTSREFRIDSYATLMWLFRDGGAVRKAAQAYLQRLGSTREK
jgi:hypothetical protein